MKRTIITGTGSYIPTVVKTNKDFAANNFYSPDNTPIGIESAEVAKKFEQITGIEERRYDCL